MFTVYGQDADAVVCGSLHDQLASSDEGFLIGQRDIHPFLDSMERRLDAGSTDEGCQDDVSITFIDEFQQAVTAGKDSTRRADSTAQFLGGLFIDHASPFHLMGPNLAGHFLPMRIGSDTRQAEGLGMGVDDVDGLGPDRTSAA